MNLPRKKRVRNEQIRNMSAIKDKESGEERNLSKWEEERITANRDEARKTRLMKMRISESKEKAEEVRRIRKEEAKENEIDAELANLFDRWQAEAREDSETIDWTEDEEEKDRAAKKVKLSHEKREVKQEESREAEEARTGERIADERESKETKRIRTSLDDEEA